MSLVDYASSDEEAAEEEQELKVSEQDGERNTIIAEEKRHRIDAPIDQSSAPQLHLPIPHNTRPHNQSSRTTVYSQREECSKELEPPALKLPDASLLLTSPALPSHFANAANHSSLVAAAMAESVSRKRDLNGSSSSSSSSYPRHKVPRGNLTHLKRVQDTADGHLLPPQLTGRSNIVTEDINKLFVKRRVDSSSK